MSDPIGLQQIQLAAGDICAGYVPAFAVFMLVPLAMSLWRRFYRIVNGYDDLELEKLKNELFAAIDELPEKPKRKPIRLKLGDDGELIPAEDDELSMDELLHSHNNAKYDGEE